MDLDTFITAAKLYNRLGWAVQDQLDDILSGSIYECNPNAVRMCVEMFKQVELDDSEDVLQEMKEFLGSVDE